MDFEEAMLLYMLFANLKGMTITMKSLLSLGQFVDEKEGLPSIKLFQYDVVFSQKVEEFMKLRVESQTGVSRISLNHHCFKCTCSIPELLSEPFGLNTKVKIVSDFSMAKTSSVLRATGVFPSSSPLKPSLNETSSEFLFNDGEDDIIMKKTSGWGEDEEEEKVALKEGMLSPIAGKQVKQFGVKKQQEATTKQIMIAPPESKKQKEEERILNFDIEQGDLNDDGDEDPDSLF